MIQVREEVRRHYRAVDESQETITWSEIVERLESETIHDVVRPSRRRTGVVIAVVSALIVLVLGLVSILTLGQQTPPADTVVPTTVVVPTPITPPVEGDRSAAQPIRVANDFERIDFSEVEPVVGSFGWTQAEGDQETLPNLRSSSWCECGIQEDPSGGYRAVAPDWSSPTEWRLWRSDDAMSWTYEPTDDPQSPSGWGYGPDPLTIVQNRDGAGTEFELEPPVLPEVEGLDLEVITTVPQPQVTVDGAVLVTGELVGTFRWDDVYGTFEICDPVECFDEPPIVWFGKAWIDNSLIEKENTAWVTHPEFGSVIAELQVQFGDSSVRFVDSGTDLPVLEINVPSPELMEKLFDDLHTGFFLELSDLSLGNYTWVGSENDPFRLTDPIPGDPFGLIALPNGGFGNFGALGNTQDGTFGDVYVSSDGGSWEVVVPEFIVDRAISGAWVTTEGDRLLAEVSYRNGGQERWTSPDGIEWTFEFQYPGGSTLHKTSWGWIALGEGRQFVSIDDGATWAQLPEAPGLYSSLEFPIGGSSAGGTTGDDLIWIVHDHGPSGDGIRRLLWIGRFDTEG